MNQNIVSQLESELESLRRRKTEAEDSRRQLEVEIRSIDGEVGQIATALEVLAKRGFRLERPVQPAVKAAAESMLQATVSKRVKILTVAVEMLQIGSATTEAILDRLDIAGIQVSGGDRKAQLRNLSSYLSRAKPELGLDSTRNGWMMPTKKGESPVAAGLSSANVSRADNPL